MAIGRTNCGAGGASGLPEFTYTGSYTLLDDGNKNWRIKFLTSGTLTFTRNPGIMDVFLLGAGGSGASSGHNGAGSGGGSGYTLTSVATVTPDTAYPIVIGAGAVNSNGGSTSAFSKTALGGYKGITSARGGNGGSGGGGGEYSHSDGGSDGSNGGSNEGSTGGTGQGTTTREFAELTGTLYAEGGDGSGTPTAKLENTGDGGDGASNSNAPSAGGSGIAILRNHREVAA